MIKILILAVVQGIAEFLPISSSGHLVIIGAALGEQSESATLEIILHAGTLGSILVIYWRRIVDLLFSDRRVIPLLLIGTVPAAVIGLLIKANFEAILKNPMLAGLMLIVTGGFLVILGKLKPQEGEYRSLGWYGAFIIGCFQAFAILPGVSRSGSTILGGRLMGLKNEDSVTFSFLLAIPAILGATVLAVRDLLEQAGSPPNHSYWELVGGAIVAFVVGIVALRWLIGWSREDRLHWFAWWCIPMGFLVTVLCAVGVI